MAYPPKVRERMLALRDLIFTVAQDTESVGELQETLKWGEPAYVTAASRLGSTVRMDWKAKKPDQYAVYFNCNTGLVDMFRTLFPKDFEFEGNRAIVFHLDEQIAEDALAVCLAAALTYHAKKRKKLASVTVQRAA